MTSSYGSLEVLTTSGILPRIASGNILILSFALSILIALVGLGHNFPVPWSDESSFMFQAISWDENWSLFSPVLSAKRTLMWMQPGYMITAGTIFKLTGFAFDIARQISWVVYLISFLVLSTWVNKTFGIAMILIVAAGFLQPSSLVVGNVARMDVFILLLSIITFVQLTEKRIIAAIAFVLIGTLFHFNMLYMLLPLAGAMAYQVHAKGTGGLFVSNNEVLLLVVALLLLVSYGAFVLFHFDIFLHDMEYQFARKLGRPSFVENKGRLLYVMIMVGLAGYSFVTKRYLHLILFLTAAAFFLMRAIGQETWYLVFENMSHVLAAVAIGGLLQRPLFKFVLISFCITLFLFDLSRGVSGMRPSLFAEPYISDQAKERIQAELLKFKGSHGDKLSVAFGVSGIDLVFYNFARAHGLNMVHKLAQSFEPMRAVDVCIFVSRPYDPKWLVKYRKEQKQFFDCKLGVITSARNDHVEVYKVQR